MSFEELKKFAISDILSVSGKEKLSRVIDSHISNLIELALVKGAASRQAEIESSYKIGYQEGFNSRHGEIDELQKQIDAALEILEYNEYVDSPMQALEILKGQNNG